MQKRFRRRTSLILLAILLGVTACANIGLLAEIIPQFDLFIHFQVQYLVALLVLGVIFMFLRNWLFLVLSLICMIFPIIRIAPWYFGESEKGHPTLTILTSNIKGTNTNTQAIQEMVELEDADIVVLLESTYFHQEELVALEETYQFTYSNSLGGGSGFLLYSKFPLSNIEAPSNGIPHVVSVASTVETPDGAFDLVAVHLTRPGLRHGGVFRDSQLLQLTKLLKNRRENLVVIGDFNTSMWTQGYELFEQENHLRNMRRGRGIVPTWGMNALGPLFSIPIDHCFISGELLGAVFETITLAGSDHLAIVVGIVLE
ncbi:MAG: endonuclease/exonuclease/phosphatase family protein [Phycisphaerales bacterium]|nr:endonuclease/exonuclease/phosphatase family protein [Planctomycetota bacterium]MBL6998069.1 endonuclease/exonuclease/phosphatase family protein [Phycisphaerales bacterium]